MEEVQSWWEVPAISYYCSLLGHGFGLPEFDVKALEQSLVSDDALYPELCSVLLQAIDHKSEYNGWKEAASSVLEEHDKTNPFNTGQDSELTPWDKLDVLYSLCELRMDCHDVAAILKNIEKWQLKVLVIGEDSNDMLYWYFTGTRIYCQDTSVSERRRTNRRLSRDTVEKQGIRKLACESLLKIHDTPRSNMIKSRSGAVHWSIVTHTYPECLSFTAKFENSTEPEEETLYRNLAKVVLPKVKQVVEEEETKRSMAGGGTGLTRSGRKVVARLKNGFIATPKEDTEEEKEEDNQLTRSSKRRRTAPPKTTATRHTPLRATRSNSHVEDITPVSKGRSRGRRSSLTCKDSGKESSPDESQEDSKDEEDNGPVEKIDRRRREHRQHRRRSKSIVVSKNSRRPRADHSTLKDQVDQAIAAAREKRRAITPPEGADVELNEALTKVMVALVNHPEAWQFNEPVKEEFAPYYYKLTKNPRDFNQIDKNVIEFKYNSAEAFAEDIHLVFTNCFDYNGPLNEYTKAARVLEKYFRKLIKEFFDDFSFDDYDSSVIHPRKRPFVNRHKRIKEIQRGEVTSMDESSRDSTDDSNRDRRKPGPKPGHRSSTGNNKRRTKRKKTEDEQQVSFTDLLSDTYPPQQAYQYPPGYHPGYHGYPGYQYPPHMYPDYHRERQANNEPTYIELSPARPKAQPKQQYKHDDEPLLFPLLPRRPLPRPSLPASSVPEHHMLRLLEEDRPSQINAIDSTTTPGTTTATTAPDAVHSTTQDTPTPVNAVAASSDSTSELSDAKPSDSSVSTSNNEDVSTSKEQDKTEDKSSENQDENNVSTSKTEDVSTSEKNGETPTCKPAAESSADSTIVNGTHEPTVNGQSLNNEALSKDTSEASPKKEETKAAVIPPAEVKPIERPVPAYPTYPSYQYEGYPGYPGSPNPAYHGSPNPAYHGSPYHGSYSPYSPAYSGYSAGYHPGYHQGYPTPGGYHNPQGYHSPVAYQQGYSGYSQYTPGTQYSNGYHPSPLAQQACVTPLNSKQIAVLSRAARGRGTSRVRRGKGSRGPRGGGAAKNGHSSPEATTNGSTPAAVSIDDNPWIDPSDGLDEEKDPIKKKKEVIDIRIKPKCDKPRRKRTRHKNVGEESESTI